MRSDVLTISASLMLKPFPGQSINHANCLVPGPMAVVPFLSIDSISTGAAARAVFLSSCSDCFSWRLLRESTSHGCAKRPQQMAMARPSRRQIPSTRSTPRTQSHGAKRCGTQPRTWNREIKRSRGVHMGQGGRDGVPLPQRGRRRSPERRAGRQHTGQTNRQPQCRIYLPELRAAGSGRYVRRMASAHEQGDLFRKS